MDELGLRVESGLNKVACRNLLIPPERQTAILVVTERRQANFGVRGYSALIFGVRRAN